MTAPPDLERLTQALDDYAGYGDKIEWEQTTGISLEWFRAALLGMVADLQIENETYARAFRRLGELNPDFDKTRKGAWQVRAERAEAALREIADGAGGHSYDNSCRQIARAALAAGREEPRQ